VLNPEISLNDRLPDRIVRNSELAEFASRWQPVILRLRNSAPPALRNLLSGTALGHSLHPVLTDIPIGAWTVTALLDVLGALGAPDVALASDAALGLGLAGGLGAIVTGYADWADTSDDPRTLGMLHAAMNSAAFSGYAASLLLRVSGQRRLGVAVAMASYGVMAFSAFLGGELMGSYQLGVKHTAVPKPPPERFVRVASLDEVADGTMHSCDIDGIPVLVLRLGEDVLAMSGACSHRGAPLGEGKVEGAAGDCVRCPWHGSLFSFRDGSVVEGPATFPQGKLETRIVAGQISVRAPQR